MEVANIEECDDEEVERVEGTGFDWKAPVRVRRQPAFYLNPELTRTDSRVGVNADEVIPFIIWRGLVCQNIPSHQVAHGEVFGTERNYRIPCEAPLFLSHLSTAFSRLRWGRIAGCYGHSTVK